MGKEKISVVVIEKVEVEFKWYREKQRGGIEKGTDKNEIHLYAYILFFHF